MKSEKIKVRKLSRLEKGLITICLDTIDFKQTKGGKKLQKVRANILVNINKLRWKLKDDKK